MDVANELHDGIIGNARGNSTGQFGARRVLSRRDKTSPRRAADLKGPLDARDIIPGVRIETLQRDFPMNSKRP
jgi:hypothetical protein